MISVCVAAFNGEKYIEEQLNSILSQLEAGDEVIVSDDGSTDRTLRILESFTQKDQRVKLVHGPGQGIIRNYDYVISLSQGDFIFLADQDDVWLPEKVAQVTSYFDAHPKTLVVVSDLMIVDEQLQELEPSYFSYRHVKTGFFSNIIKNKYIGAGMAFRSQLKELILPIPAEVPMHDMWIGLLAESRHGAALLPEVLTLYRRHDDNASQIATKTKFRTQLAWRLRLVKCLFLRLVFHQ